MGSGHRYQSERHLLLLPDGRTSHAESKGGRIINVASTSGLVALTGMAAYSATKGGIILLTKTLGAEMAKYNIRVNCIAPGHFISPLNAEIYSSDQSLSEATLKRIPLQREGELEEIAAAALFLAADASNYITGETIAVDGGWSTSPRTAARSTRGR